MNFQLNFDSAFFFHSSLLLIRLTENLIQTLMGLQTFACIWYFTACPGNVCRKETWATKRHFAQGKLFCFSSWGWLFTLSSLSCVITDNKKNQYCIYYFLFLVYVCNLFTKHYLILALSFVFLDVYYTILFLLSKHTGLK